MARRWPDSAAPWDSELAIASNVCPSGPHDHSLAVGLRLERKTKVWRDYFDIATYTKALAG